MSDLLERIDDEAKMLQAIMDQASPTPLTSRLFDTLREARAEIERLRAELDDARHGNEMLRNELETVTRRFADWVRSGYADKCVYDDCPHETDEECIEYLVTEFERWIPLDTEAGEGGGDGS